MVEGFSGRKSGGRFILVGGPGNSQTRQGSCEARRGLTRNIQAERGGAENRGRLQHCAQLSHPGSAINQPAAPLLGRSTP